MRSLIYVSSEDPCRNSLTLHACRKAGSVCGSDLVEHPLKVNINFSLVPQGAIKVLSCAF